MSGNEWLLDTNVVIGLLKGSPAVLDLLGSYNIPANSLAVSQISRMELLGYPQLTAQEEAVITGFLGTCRICLLDETIEHEAIRLRRTGRLKLPDAIITATALVGGLQLVTLDQAMFNVWQREKP